MDSTSKAIKFIQDKDLGYFAQKYKELDKNSNGDSDLKKEFNQIKELNLKSMESNLPLFAINSIPKYYNYH